MQLYEGNAMYCVNCGSQIIEGEHVCKGCGALDAETRDEILSFKEKTEDMTCKKCGGPIHKGNKHCRTCGAAVDAE